MERAKSFELKVPHIWAYEPPRPMVMCFVNDAVDNDVWISTLGKPSDVFAAFAEELLPPRRSTRAAVIDEEGVALFGYIYDHQAVAELGTPMWIGCQFGFWVMEHLQLVDRVDLAIWESVARTYVEHERKWWDGPAT